jgi:glutathione peroxidase
VKSLFLSLVVLQSAVALAAPSFYALDVESIEGKKEGMSQYKGKAVLVVNTASECGFTNQYRDLEALYKKYQAKGFVILAFPSNDFGAQEPGNNAEIKKFCENKFKVSFPLFAKNPVTGPQKQPMYKFLTETATPKDEVSWNFEKFLINRKGEVVARYKSAVSPSAPELDKAVAAVLTK